LEGIALFSNLKKKRKERKKGGGRGEEEAKIAGCDEGN